MDTYTTGGEHISNKKSGEGPTYTAPVVPRGHSYSPPNTSTSHRYILFSHQGYQKDEFEEVICPVYTLFHLCDGPKQVASGKLRVIANSRYL